MGDKKLLIAIGIIVLVVVIGIGIVKIKNTDNFTGLAITNPLKTCSEVQVPYETQEAYEEQEPYQAIEEYQEPLKYSVVSAQDGFTTGEYLNYLKTLTVQIRNVDSETGLFTVKMIFKTLKDPETTKEIRQYVMPGETKSFYQTYDSDLGEDVNTKYAVIPGEKTMTRTVTNYRTVTKYKPVTKYRTEEKCI